LNPAKYGLGGSAGLGGAEPFPEAPVAIKFDENFEGASKEFVRVELSRAVWSPESGKFTLHLKCKKTV